MDDDGAQTRLAARMADRGLRLVDHDAERLEAECLACRARWPIAAGRVGPAHEDAAADWWWCPNGCNREE